MPDMLQFRLDREASIENGVDPETLPEAKKRTRKSLPCEMTITYLDPNKADTVEYFTSLSAAFAEAAKHKDVCEVTILNMSKEARAIHGR